jgi:hypothetical protein
VSYGENEKVDFLRERRTNLSDCTAGGARPKDLLSAVPGPDSRRESSPAVLPARSFGQRPDCFNTSGSARRLPQEVIGEFPVGAWP